MFCTYTQSLLLFSPPVFHVCMFGLCTHVCWFTATTVVQPITLRHSFHLYMGLEILLSGRQEDSNNFWSQQWCFQEATSIFPCVLWDPDSGLWTYEKESPLLLNTLSQTLLPYLLPPSISIFNTNSVLLFFSLSSSYNINHVVFISIWSTYFN